MASKEPRSKPLEVFVQDCVNDFNTFTYVYHGSYNFRQTNFKDFSRIFQGQITVFKDYILYYFPQQQFAKMTGYDLQLHLRYRRTFGIYN